MLLDELNEEQYGCLFGLVLMAVSLAIFVLAGWAAWYIFWTVIF